jgi:hypothetical protein
MTSETFQEFKARIEASDWHYGIFFTGLRPSFKSDQASFLRLGYPTSPGTVAYAANLSVRIASMYYDRAYFGGATLWFADAPFDSWEHAAGRVVIDRIRAGLGDLRPFSFDLIHHFQSEEIELLTAFMILGTVLAWDFYVLSPDGNRIIFMSHDELFGVYTKTDEVKAELSVLLSDEIVTGSHQQQS